MAGVKKRAESARSHTFGGDVNAGILTANTERI